MTKTKRPASPGWNEKFITNPAAKHWARKSILICAYCFLVALKIHQTTTSPRYNATDDTLLYQSEGALQYRYAKMIANRESIPAVDHSMQAPEGLVVARELTVGMEYVAGYGYRLLGEVGIHPPFHRYLGYFVAAFSSLTVFAIYGLALILWEAPSIALGSAALYAAIPAGLGRTAANYLLEDFAVPFIFAGLFFLVKVLRDPEQNTIRHSTIFSLLVAASLITWHFSKFFLTTLVASLISLRLLDKDVRLRKPLTILAIVLVFFGASLPVLRAQYFAISLPMLSLYAILATLYGKEELVAARSRPYIAIVFVVSLSALYALTYQFQKIISADYAHVTSLLYYKLRYALIKPWDPSLLNLDARMLWIEDFDSPSLNFIVFRLSSLSVLGLGALIAALTMAAVGRLRRDQKLIVLITLMFVAGSIMVRRLFIFEGPLLCVLLGSLILIGPRAKRLLPIALAIIVPIEAYGSIQYYGKLAGFRSWIGERDSTINSDPRSPNMRLAMQADYRELISWIRRRTPLNSVFLTFIGESAEIAAYTGRGSNLQPKFETKASRDKAYKFVQALYSSEEELFQLCLTWKTNYVIYHPVELLSTSRESLRYFANAMSVSANSVAFQFHFYPEKLRHFVLVYENPGCRVYRVVRERADARAIHPNPELPVYNARLFKEGVHSDGTFNDASVPGVTADLLRTTQLNQSAYTELAAGNNAHSLQLFEEIIGHGFASAAVYYGAGSALLRLRDAKAAAHYLKIATEQDPERADTFRDLAYADMLNGDSQDAARNLRRASELDPDDAIAANNLAVILMSRGDRSGADDLLTKAHAISPRNSAIAGNYHVLKSTGATVSLRYLY